MEGKLRRIRRRQLDELFSDQIVPATPSGGWIRTIRESIGMSLDSLGKRLGVSRQAASQLEKSELEDRITIQTLKGAAEALNCDLVVYLRPRTSLDEMVLHQARLRAEESVNEADHSMRLESQELTPAQHERLVELRVRELIEKYETKIW